MRDSGKGVAVGDFGLLNHHNGTGPGAAGLLDDPIMNHPANLLLNSLMASFGDSSGPLSNHHSRCGLNLMLQQVCRAWCGGEDVAMLVH